MFNLVVGIVAGAVFSKYLLPYIVTAWAAVKAYVQTKFAKK